MRKPLGTLRPPCGSRVPRRNAVRQIGGWAIYLGVVAASACGRTPLGDPFGFAEGDDDDDASTTQTPTPTVTETPELCSCDPVSGAPAGLNASDVPENAFAVNDTLNIFICHDAAGYFAMSDRCTAHQQNMTDNGSSFNPDNLSQGFVCAHQGSRFDGNGERIGGPAPAGSSLTHYLLTIDPTGELYLDLAVIVDKDCRCNPA